MNTAQLSADDVESRRRTKLGILDACEAYARRVFAILVSGCALLMLGLPMLVIALAIKSTSPGPVLFTQQRVGLNLTPFLLFKFRTMRVGSDDSTLREHVIREMRGEDTSRGGSWKIVDDRITPIGAVLRRWSLDELPQLFNVLRGDMSLVGPRPCLEWEALLFTPEFGERFTVRPGLTGLWQVSGRSRMGTREMLQLDVDYVRHRTMRGDLSILMRTIPAVLRVDGAR